jgi:diguanylate cyclase (GGDEF)-like protein/PAS domain S-box-containing protein
MGDDQIDDETPPGGPAPVDAITPSEPAEPDAVRLSLEAFEDLLEHGTDMVTVIDAEGRCTYASPAVSRMSGFAPSEVLKRDASESMHPDDLERVMGEAMAQFTGQSPANPIRFRQTCKDGSFIHVEAQISRLPADHPLGFAVINTRDISERRGAERARDESTAIIRMVAEGQPLPEVLTSIARMFQRRVPGSLVALFRVDEAAQSLRVAAAPSMPKTFLDQIDGIEIGPRAGSSGAAAFHRQSVIVGDISADRRWDDLAALAERHDLRACWSTPVISSDAGRVLGTFSVYWREPKVPVVDHLSLINEAAGLATVAFERYRIEGELAHQATHDDLTGLPNRTVFNDRLTQALARRKRRDGGSVAALFVDLDHFKPVNDEHGHAVGDALLVEVGARLRSTVREVDTVARFGGDEFIVLCHTDDVSVLAGRINESLTAPFTVGGHSLRVSASIGVAIADDLTTAASLVHDADLALYEAKRQGRNCFRIYETAMRDEAENHVPR